MITLSGRPAILAIAFAANVIPAHVVFAQDAGQAQASSSDQLQEIVVTSQKRAENTRTIPISLSALTGNDLAEKQISNFDDLTRSVPGFSFGSGGSGLGAGPGLDNIEIRGISSSSGSAVVGVYLDETSITVPNRFDGMTEPLPFDLERVEILRGPQGSLYGASSMGGTVRFITNKPDLDNYHAIVSGDLSGTVHGGVNHNESAVVNVPIVPGILAVRAGFEFGEDSGWVDSYNYRLTDSFAGPLIGQIPTTLNKSGVNNERHAVFKLSALYEPSDDLSITPSIWIQRVHAADSPIFYPQDGLYKQTKEVADSSYDTVVVPSLSIQKDLGFATFNSISSLFKRNFDRQIDGTFYNSTELSTLFLDFSPLTSPAQVLKGNAQIAHLPSPEYLDTRYDQYSQEFRLSSGKPAPGELPLKWTVGFYYNDQNTYHQNNGYVPGLGAAFDNVYGYQIGSADAINLFNTVTPPNSVTPTTFSRNLIYGQGVWEDVRQYAVFGQVDYDILPDLHASAGLRYLIARTSYRSDATGFYSIGAAGNSYDYGHYYAATPKFSLSYDLSENAMLYTTIAKGFRLGGAAGPTPQGPNNVCSTDYSDFGISAPPKQFGSDKLWSYEAGTKARLADGTVEISAAAYIIEWNNIQQNIVLPICGYSFIANTGDAESYGIEGEAKWKPRFAPGLILGVTANAANSTITRTNFPQVVAVGEHVPYAPYWTATVSGSYDWPINDALSGFVQADYDWTGKSYGTYTESGSATACDTNASCFSPNYSNPAYGILNASVGVRTDDYEVELYAKNLANDQTIIQRPQVASLVTGQTVRPATFGIRASKKF